MQHAIIVPPPSSKFIPTVVPAAILILLISVIGCGGEIGNSSIDNAFTDNQLNDSQLSEPELENPYDASLDAASQDLAISATHVRQSQEYWLPTNAVMANYGATVYFSTGVFANTAIKRMLSFYNADNNALPVWTAPLGNDIHDQRVAAASRGSTAAYLTIDMTYHGHLAIHDMRSGTPLFPVYTAFPANVNDARVFVNADGRYVYTVLNGASGLDIRRFDLNSANPMQPVVLTLSGASILSAMLSEDGNTLAILPQNIHAYAINTMTMSLRANGDQLVWADSTCVFAGNNFFAFTERGTQEKVKVYKMDANGGYPAQPSEFFYLPAGAVCWKATANGDKLGIGYARPTTLSAGIKVYRISNDSTPAAMTMDWETSTTGVYPTPADIHLRNNGTKAFIGLRYSNTEAQQVKIAVIYNTGNGNQVRTLTGEGSIMDDTFDVDPFGERFTAGMSIIQNGATNTGWYAMGTVGSNGISFNSLPVAGSATTLSMRLPADAPATKMESSTVRATPINYNFGAEYLPTTRTATALGNVSSIGELSISSIVPALGQCTYLQFFTTGVRRWSHLVPLCGLPTPQ